MLPHFRHKFVNKGNDLNIVFEHTSIKKQKKAQAVIGQTGMWNPQFFYGGPAHPLPQQYNTTSSRVPTTNAQKRAISQSQDATFQAV